MLPRVGSSLYSTLVASTDSDSDQDEDKKTAMLISSSISTQGLLPWRTPSPPIQPLPSPPPCLVRKIIAYMLTSDPRQQMR